MKNPPVIIIGMHRSGTGMISSMLEMLGLFGGYKQEKNHEALFFLRLNEWIFDQANASWDNPYNFSFVNENFKKEIIRVMKLHLSGYRRWEYLGTEKFLKYKSIKEIDFPWGWKDPKNTFTVGIWKEIFPDAKILHIYRNPVDVAESLRRREIRVIEEFNRNFKKAVKEFFLLRKVYYQYSLRIQNINEGIKLWQEYINKAFSLNEEFKENILHVRYETFLENPEVNLKNILGFIKLPVNESHLAAVAKSIKAERRFAFIKDENLIKLYQQIRENDVMKKLDYHNII